jgi:hypothetical protein
MLCAQADKCLREYYFNPVKRHKYLWFKDNCGFLMECHVPYLICLVYLTMYIHCKCYLRFKKVWNDYYRWCLGEIGVLTLNKQLSDFVVLKYCIIHLPCYSLTVNKSQFISGNCIQLNWQPVIMESHGRMILTGKTLVFGENPIPVSLLPSQIPHGLFWARTRASDRPETNRLSHDTSDLFIITVIILNNSLVFTLKLTPTLHYLWQSKYCFPRFCRS